MQTKNIEQNVRALTLAEIVASETKTASQNLAVRSGVRAGGGTGTLGKFAKYV